MNRISKYRIFNSCVIMSIGGLLLVLLISWAFNSSFMEVMFFMDYGAEDLEGTVKEIRHALLFNTNIFTWEMYIDSAMWYLVNFLPLFAVIPVIPFLKEKKSYFVYGSNRFKSYIKTQIFTILKYGLVSGLCISVAFSLFFTIGLAYMVPSISYIGEYTSIFPENFYGEHPYLFFMFMTWSIYFAFAFVFGLMASGVSLWTEKSYYVLLFPMVYYLASNYLSALFLGLLPIHLSACVIAFNTNYSTFKTFVPLVLPAVISVVMIATGIRNERRLMG